MQDLAVSPDSSDTASVPKPASPPPKGGDALVGRTFGSYTVLRRLGAIYLADDPGMFHQVALKLFALQLHEVMMHMLPSSVGRPNALVF